MTDRLNSLDKVLAKVALPTPVLALLFDRPPDPATLVGQIARGWASESRLVSRLVRDRWRAADNSTGRLGPGAFSRHFLLLEDPALSSISAMEPVLSKLARMALDPDLPPWLATLVNPRGSAVPAKGAPSPLSAVIFKWNHVISDGIRIMRLLKAIANEHTGAGVEAASCERHVRMNMEGFLAMPESRPDLPDAAMLVIPRRDLRGAGPLGPALHSACAKALDQSVALSDGFARTGMSVELEGYRDPLDARTGNFFGLRQVRVNPRPARVPLATRVLSIAFPETRELHLRIASALPAPFLRKAIDLISGRFDTALSLIPAGTGWPTFGGAAPVAILGIAPVIGRCPLYLTAITGFGQVGLTVISAAPGVMTSADLRDRLGSLLVRGASA